MTEADPRLVRALDSAITAVQRAGGVFLTSDQAVQLATVAVMAAEPHLRAHMLMQCADESARAGYTAFADAIRAVVIEQESTRS